MNQESRGQAQKQMNRAAVRPAEKSEKYPHSEGDDREEQARRHGVSFRIHNLVDALRGHSYLTPARWRGATLLSQQVR
jgi:hypothetical protein